MDPLFIAYATGMLEGNLMFDTFVGFGCERTKQFRSKLSAGSMISGQRSACQYASSASRTMFVQSNSR